MLKRLAFLPFACLILASSAHAEMATILLPDNWIGGTPGTTVEVPIRLNSEQQITTILMTLDFDSSVLSFVSAVRGNATGTWQLYTNADPSYEPESPGTNENLRILIFGGGTKWIIPNNAGGSEVVRVTFAINPGATGPSPVAIDLRCANSSVVQYQPIVEYCDPDLAWGAGDTVSDASSLLAARKPTLHQNVPNPFNPNTSISFSLPQNSRVELRVYDVRGQVVRSLISAEYAAGHHTITWNGTNDLGDHLPSGAYFYSLSSAEGVATRRALLLK